MGIIALGVGDLVITTKATDVLKIYGLGSCVALIMCDPLVGMTGMAHVALPSSVTSRDDALEKPGRFADTAVPILLERIETLNPHRRCKLSVKLVGGASMLDPSGLFNIGQRNLEMIRQILRENSLVVAAENIGGTASRMVSTTSVNCDVEITFKGKTRVMI